MDFVDESDTAVFAGFDRGQVGCHQRILFGQCAAVEAAGGIDHVHDPVAHGIGLLEHADSFGAAAHFDLHDTFAGLVHLVDKLQEGLGIDQRAGEGVDGGQGFLCRGDRAEHGGTGDNSADEGHFHRSLSFFGGRPPPC